MFDVGNEVAPETGTFRLEEIDRRKELRTRRSRELDPQLRLQPASCLSEHLRRGNGHHCPRLELRDPALDLLVPRSLHSLVSRKAVEKTLREPRPIFWTQFEGRGLDGVERF